MLLTITNTSAPATDIGFLLAKHPDRMQSFELPFGKAYAFYPEASLERCSFSLLLDVDPIGLVRRKDRSGPSVFAYVNDRPYVASSLMCVAIAKVLGSALNGRCERRPELIERPLELEANLPALPCRGGERFLRRLFEPLGYAVEASRLVLDATFPEWGESGYFGVSLRNRVRLRDLLRHLYLLIPVLDDGKHYWVGEAEIDKLLEKGKEWIADHPERKEIAKRYLRYHRHLTREALARLCEGDDIDPDARSLEGSLQEHALEKKTKLNEQRLSAVVSVLRDLRASSVVDLGCGEGRLLKALLESRSETGWDFTRILGMDVSQRALETCRSRLDLDRLPTKQRERIEIIQGSLTYRDRRIIGYDAAALIEVIEHLDPSRLRAFERVVFRDAKPRCVIVTTPNQEYNALFPMLEGAFRHHDHRFEWTRAEFRAWAQRLAEECGYEVRHVPVGPVHEELGAPTQMGVFSR